MSSRSTLIPLHAAVFLHEERHLPLRVHRAGPGRPRRPARAPDADEERYQARLREQLEVAIQDDGLVRATERGVHTTDTLRAALLAAATEAASIAFELGTGRVDRHLAERVRSRRVDALNTCAKIVLQIGRLGAEGVGVDEPRVRLVVDSLVREVAEVAEEVLPPDRAMALVEGVQRALEGWQGQVELGCNPGCGTSAPEATVGCCPRARG